MLQSNIVCCLTFSQDVSPDSPEIGQRQGVTALEEPQSVALGTDPSEEWEICNTIGQKMIGGEMH